MASSSRAREARVDITVGKDKLERGLRDARKNVRGFASGIKSDVASAGKKLAGGLLGGVGALAGIGGGLGLASIVTDVVDLERSLIRFQIAGHGTAATTARVRAEMDRVSRASGISREKIMGAAAAYQSLTGDTKGAVASMELFAMVTNATGASMDDIAAVADVMVSNLKIGPEDLKAGFSAIAEQGKAGKIELREQARLMASIAASGQQFKGGTGVEGLAQMGAELQVVREGFGSAAEAATGLNALQLSLIRNAKKFEQVGVKIYDKDPKTGIKNARNQLDILDDLAKKKLDPTMLIGMFGDAGAARSYNLLTRNRGVVTDLIALMKDKNAIDRDAATYQESAAGRLEKVWNNVKLMIAAAFTPERLSAFITALEHIVDMINTITNYLGKPKEAVKAAGNLVTSPITNYRVNKERDARHWGLMFGADGRFRSGDQAAAMMSLQDQTYNDLLGGKVSPRALERAKMRSKGQGPWAAAGFAPSAERVIGNLAPQQSVRDIIANANQQISITLKLGEDILAKATANAAAHRTKPGGV